MRELGIKAQYVKPYTVTTDMQRAIQKKHIRGIMHV